MSMRKGGAGEREAAPLPVKEQPPPYGYDEESEKDILGPEEEYQPCLIRYITAISRSTGIIIVCVMWLLTGVLLNHLSEHKYAPWYILAISILTTFFEIIWMLNKCVISCMRHDWCPHDCREEGCCCAFWRFLVWIDNWRKTVLYVLFAIPCFLKDIFTVETCVVGLLLLVTAGVYFTKSFKESKCVRRRRRKDAYVQTGTPRASIVSHNVQVGRDGAPEGYHAKHVLPTTVQPRESERVSRSRTGSTQSEGEIEREGYFHKEGSKRGYDRAGGSPRFDRQRDPDRRTDFYEREGYDGRERDRDRDFSSERDHDRYKKDNRDYRRGRDHDRDRDRDYDRGRDHDRYRDRDYDRGRERYSVRDHPAERGHSWDRDHERGPSRSRGIEKGSDYREEHDQDKYYSGKVHGTRSSKSETKASEAETAIEKAQEPPPLKELPYQASKEMKKSAAANLVKQVSSGSPVSTTTGSAHSGMPSKIEQKAASMSNPYDKEKRGQSSTNPFDVQEDEYFD